MAQSAFGAFAKIRSNVIARVSIRFNDKQSKFGNIELFEEYRISR